MYWKRVTCELHDSYFHLMTIKHAIPRTAEVHIPLWPVMGRYWVGVNYYITECTGNSMIWERRCAREKTAPGRRRPRDPPIEFGDQTSGRQDAVEKNSTRQKAPSGPPIEFGDQTSGRQDAVEKASPRASVWVAQKNGKETPMAIKVGVSILAVLFGLQLPLTHNPFKQSGRYIFLKGCVARLYCVSLWFCMHMYMYYVFVLLVMVMAIQQHETKLTK